MRSFSLLFYDRLQMGFQKFNAQYSNHLQLCGVLDTDM